MVQFRPVRATNLQPVLTRLTSTMASMTDPDSILDFYAIFLPASGPTDWS